MGGGGSVGTTSTAVSVGGRRAAVCGTGDETEAAPERTGEATTTVQEDLIHKCTK